MIELLKLLAVLVFIVLLINKTKLHLGVVLLLAAVATGLLFHFSAPAEFFGAVLGALTDFKDITLVILIALVVVLSVAMEASDYFGRMIKGVAAVLPSRRLRMSVLPASIGLLPMPGGAIFSAPLIAKASEGLPLNADQKGAINFWFRHVWEFCWPLYMGVIVFGKELSKLDLTLRDVLPLQAILTPTMIIGGMLFFFPRKLGAKKPEHHPGSFVKKILAAFEPLMPVMIVVVCYIGVGKFLPVVLDAFGCNFFHSYKDPAQIADRLAFIFGLLASIAYVVLFAGRKRRAVIKHVLRSPKTPSMAFMGLGIVVFGAVVGTHSVTDGVVEYFQGIGSLLPVMILLPFILGLVTGITVGYVTIAFPIIIALLAGGDPLTTKQMLPYLILAFASGFMGVMLSPAHLCLLVSRDYFKANLFRMYRYLVKPVLFTFGVAMGLFFLLRWLL